MAGASGRGRHVGGALLLAGVALLAFGGSAAGGSVAMRRHAIVLPGRVRRLLDSRFAQLGHPAANGGGHVRVIAAAPRSSSSAAPTVSTVSVDSTTATQALVKGTANPHGVDASYGVEWDLASSTWCTSDATSGAPANSQAANVFPPYTDAPHYIQTYISGLTAGTAYCAQLTGTIGADVGDGGLVTWTQGKPEVTTVGITSTGLTAAQLEATVQPAGQDTTYDVEYGAQSEPWCTSGGASGSPDGTTTPAHVGATDATAHGIVVDLTGLTAATAYCGRLVATNGSGTSAGGWQQWTQGAPTVSTGRVVQSGTSTATVEGSVDALGQATSYLAEYAAAGSTWCTSGGTAGAPSTTSSTSVSTVDGGGRDVSIDLAGLAQGTSYCAEIAATNASGTTSGSQTTWTQGAPTVDTFDAFSTAQQAVTVEGEINPLGQSTTYALEWDVAASRWCESGGTTGVPAETTTAETLRAEDESPYTVAVNLGGLDIDTKYCAAFTATNASGTSQGLPAVTWVQSASTQVTLDGHATGPSAAMVDGLSDSAGEMPDSYWVNYDSASSSWCRSGGFIGSPAYVAEAVDVQNYQEGFFPVPAYLSGLTEGASYCAELYANDGQGVGGGIVQWTQGAPVVTTDDAYSTSPSAATVDGEVDPANASANYTVEYDLAGSEWCESGGYSGTPALATTAQSLTGATGVSVNLTGLTGGESYCAAFVARNATGEGQGLPTVEWQQGAPTALTYDVNETTNTSVSVDAFVDPASQSTTYRLEWDVATSAWCGSGGTSGSPANTSAPQPLGASDGNFYELSVDLGGLADGTQYCAQMVATNADGTSEGGEISWTQKVLHTLTVQKAGTGSGDVSSYPDGIDCGTTCSAEFTDGTEVDLAAIPADGSYFVGWSGGGCAGTDDCFVTLGADASVTAIFDTNPPPPVVWLTVKGQGTGTGWVSSTPAGITCPRAGGPGCLATFGYGSHVTLTATPDPGTVFVGWSGGGCSGVLLCTITLDSAETVTATFTAVDTLTVDASGGSGSGTVTSSPAGIDCGSTCSKVFPSGSQVTLTATPAAGSVFEGFAGGGCYATARCTVTLDGDETVTATFDKKQAPPTCTLKPAGSEVALTGRNAGKLTLVVGCRKATAFSITGKVSIVPRGRKASRVALPKVRGKARAHSTVRVKLELPARALSALRAHASESVALTLTAAAGGGWPFAHASIKHLK